MPPILANPLTQLALAVVLGALGVALLLPKPRVRSVAGGTFLLVAAFGILGTFLVLRFGQPMLMRDGTNSALGSVIFWVFALGSVLFGVQVVVQRNPARGAIAFAFVILSTCGLFLLLAAPFLMAATIVVYAGAIIVTFLFVLMLSNVRGPSDENDRTREPLLGSLAGFGFIGLLLFALHQGTAPSNDGFDSELPSVVVSNADRTAIEVAYGHVEAALAIEDAAAMQQHADEAQQALAVLLESSPSISSNDPGAKVQAERIASLKPLLRKLSDASLENKPEALRESLVSLRESLSLLRGVAELPARNVANLGYLLYSEYLLAVEMAGTLLLVATIGAVAIAARRKEATA